MVSDSESRERSSTRRGWMRVLLGLSALVFVYGLFTAYNWQRTRLQRRGLDVLAQLVAAQSAPRVMEAPGVEAWLRAVTHAAGPRTGPRARLAYERLLRPSDGEELPEALDPLRQLLASVTTIAEPVPNYRRGALATTGAQGRDTPADPVLRSLEHIAGPGGERGVLTRRSRLSGGDTQPGSTLFIRQALPRLEALARDWSKRYRHTALLSVGVPESQWLKGFRVVRFYAISEDGSFLSRPMAGAEGLEASLANEVEQCRKRRFSPNFVTQRFFFDFDFSRPLEDTFRYSGLYIDIAGSGFVATLTAPLDLGPGDRTVVAVDVAFEVSLDELIAAVEVPMQLAVARGVHSPNRGEWQPWSRLAAALDPAAPAALRSALEQRVLREGLERLHTRPDPVVHDPHSSGNETVFAVQVSDDAWLVARLAAAHPEAAWQWLLLGLSPATLLVWLVLLIRGRRRVSQRLDRHRQLPELLRLPMMVVDPNTDTVVRANGYARALGVRPGIVIRDTLLPDEPEQRSRYRDMQNAGEGQHRAYGLAMNLQGAEGKTRQQVLIRSVSLKSGPPLFGGEAGQRLAWMCPLDPEADLGPALSEHEAETRQDERNKLGALSQHGVDALARVLADSIKDPASHAFSRWLAEYIHRRVHVNQWVLDHWGQPPESEVRSLLERDQACATIERYRQIFIHVAGHARLRAQMHWNNGILATEADPSDPLRLRVEWPESLCLPLPSEGLFGFAIGEALINAIRHGRPGSQVEVVLDADLARQELRVRVRNMGRVEESGGRALAGRSYGGRAILSELARQCGWRCESGLERGGQFVFELECTMSLRRSDARAD